jgi:hypothetical protein
MPNKTETLNPYNNLDRMSLPLSSVPIKFTEEGEAGFGYGEK